MRSRSVHVVLAAGLLLGLSAASALAGPSALRLGGGFALTGPGASIEVPAHQGALLAVEEINAAGGVLGAPLELVVHDSRSDPALAAELARRAIGQDRVHAFLGYMDSDPVLAAAPLFQQAGIAFLTVGATSPRLPAQVGDSLFLAAFGDNVQAAAGAQYALERIGETAVLLWDDSHEYTRLLADYFRQAFEHAGGQVVLAQAYAGDAADFPARVLALQALPRQPAFYYLAAMPSNVGSLVGQLREAGLDGPIVGGDGYDTPDLLAVAGAAAEGVHFTTHALMDAELGTEAVKGFMAAYAKKYGRAPDSAFAALGYDSVRLLAQAIARAGSTEGAVVKAALEATEGFVGVSGRISYAPGQHVPRKSVTLIAVQGGRFTLGAEVEPRYVPPP